MGQTLKKNTRQLLKEIYDGQIDQHIDLYELSNQHRRKHGPSCDMYPSDPLQAPLWSVITFLTHAKRILEIGCGYGYTAAVMASAAGPNCHVDTIEQDPSHAKLAADAFEQRGLSKRISIVQGRGEKHLS
jgi:predicted O-methyltransferase YrrM